MKTVEELEEELQKAQEEIESLKAKDKPKKKKYKPFEEYGLRRPKKFNRADWRRMRELREQGWSYGKIADEFNTTKQTIIVYTKRYKEEDVPE